MYTTIYCTDVFTRHKMGVSPFFVFLLLDPDSHSILGIIPPSENMLSLSYTWELPSKINDKTRNSVLKYAFETIKADKLTKNLPSYSEPCSHGVKSAPADRFLSLRSPLNISLITVIKGLSTYFLKKLRFPVYKYLDE